MWDIHVACFFGANANATQRCDRLERDWRIGKYSKDKDNFNKRHRKKTGNKTGIFGRSKTVTGVDGYWKIPKEEMQEKLPRKGAFIV